jgi:hypothetical protein
VLGGGWAGVWGGGGADDEVRTRDIQIGNLKLYQLSYVRILTTGMAADAVYSAGYVLPASGGS